MAKKASPLLKAIKKRKAKDNGQMLQRIRSLSIIVDD